MRRRLGIPGFVPLLLLSMALTLRAAEKAVTFLGTLGDKPIRMDLRLPDGDGKAAGTGLYLKEGRIVALAGGRTGESVVLQETYLGKPTGSFELTASPKTDLWPLWKRIHAGKGNRELHGAWRNPGRKRGSTVSLAEIDPAHVACALLDPDSLRRADGTGSFGNELDDLADPEGYPSGFDWDILLRLRVTHCGRGLAGFRVDILKADIQDADTTWHAETVRYAFDSARRQEVSFLQELDSSRIGSCRTRFSARLDPLVDRFRARFPDSVWNRILAGRREDPGSLFRQTQESGSWDFHLVDGKAYLGYAGILGDDSKRMSESGLLDDDVHIEVSDRDLAECLKPTSVLRKLQDGR